MKVGDLVRVKPDPGFDSALVEEDWIGVIVEFRKGYVAVYWSEQYPYEEEYLHQLEVISESR